MAHKKFWVKSSSFPQSKGHPCVWWAHLTQGVKIAEFTIRGVDGVTTKDQKSLLKKQAQC